MSHNIVEDEGTLQVRAAIESPEELIEFIALLQTKLAFEFKTPKEESNG